MQIDATRILLFEAGVSDVCDPWAGSYFMESLTDETEAAARAEFDHIEAMGGAVAAIETRYMPMAIAQSAYDRQQRIESQQDFVVGVNCFTGDQELTVPVPRVVEKLYDPAQMATAEERQLARLAELKRTRDGAAARRTLSVLGEHAKDEARNLMPDIIDCVKAEATLQEICDALRSVFGEAEARAL